MDDHNEKLVYGEESSNLDSGAEAFQPAVKPTLHSAMRLYLVIFILLIIFGSIFQLIHFEIGMVLTQVLIILLPAIWYWKRYRVNLASFARLKPLSIRFVPIIILLSASMWVMNMVFAALMVTGLIEIGYEPTVVLAPPVSFSEYLLYLLVLSFFAGICEEMLFRGAIMPSMESKGLVPALVFSSFLFALFHVSILNLFSTFILGLVMAIVVVKTGSIWGGVIYHMLNNFYAATYLYFVGQMETVAEVDDGSLIALLPLFIIALVGAYLGFRLLQKHSVIAPLWGRGEGLLPRGWFGWILAVSLLIYLVIIFFELAVGFGWFGLDLL